MNEYGDDGIIQAIHDDLPIPHELTSNAAKHRAIIFMAFICVCEFFVSFFFSRKKLIFSFTR